MKNEETRFVKSLISGGGGAPMYENVFYHYIVVEVGDEVTYTVVKVEA